MIARLPSLLLILVAIPTFGQESNSHLFILSGQSNMGGLDPEISFIPTVEKEFGPENTIVIKDAQGGQPIRRWHRDWKDFDGNGIENAGDLYDRLLSKVSAAVEGKRPFDSITFVWMQGERDANEGLGEVYFESLAGLVEQLKTDLEFPELNVVVGRLSDFDLNNQRYGHWSMVREAQMEFAETNSRSVWIDTDDLNDGLNRRGKEISNDLHMSVKGYEMMGLRFAEAAIKLIRENEK